MTKHTPHSGFDEIRRVSIHVLDGDLINGPSDTHAEDCPGCKIEAALQGIEEQSEDAVALYQERLGEAKDKIASLEEERDVLRRQNTEYATQAAIRLQKWEDTKEQYQSLRELLMLDDERTTKIAVFWRRDDGRQMYTEMLPEALNPARRPQ